jgi:dolichyl-phosphate beta-glucosyltransferase
MSEIYLSVIIPTYNEAKRIELSIRQVEDYFKSKKITGEIIVSDDFSKDKTVEIVEQLMASLSNLKVLKSDKNYFKGYPVKKGMLEAKGKYVLFADADMATPITEADKLIDAINAGADLAIGSRIQTTGKDLRGTQPFYRRILGKMFTFAREFLVRGIKDSQTGFKMFSHDVAVDLFSRQKIENIIFDVEILYMAKKLNYKIAEIPVEWNYGGETRMHVTLKNAVMTLSSLARIWFSHHWIKA